MSMNEREAKKIIEDIFKAKYNEDSFRIFTENLLFKAEMLEEHASNAIPQGFQNSISSMKRIAKYEDQLGNKIDVLAVKIKDCHKLEYSRTMQRNFIARYLNGSRGGQLKDAALVAFYADDCSDWRFSLIKMDYKFDEQKQKIKEEFTPARRYSFLVGPEEGVHTACQQFIPVLQLDNNITLEYLEKSFDIEKVTDEFFGKYKERFLELKEALDKICEQDSGIKFDFEFRKITPAHFCKKLMGQIVFLYFLQKKGWLGVDRDKKWGQGDKNFLSSLFSKAVAEGKNYFNDYLEPLFYEALATERDNDYYSPFNCKIPFLNGGLFEPLNEYDWSKFDILIPNNLFSNSTPTKEGDIGNGVLDIFNRYNFTVREDEALEKEVAVDPEMLGKVFENLLEVQDRKSKGAFYTPREIVHYMCQESLINYLYNKVNTKQKPIGKAEPKQQSLLDLGSVKSQQELTEDVFEEIISKSDIETFIHNGDLVQEHENRITEKGTSDTYKPKLPDSIRRLALELDKALEDVLICDPAIGSGAFPVGMMNEIVRARLSLLEAGLIKDNAPRNAYEYKRQAIQNSIYGVDIDQGAIDIAKLRLWLSLVVDEAEMNRIRPLPNLSYKIVCGNSLLSIEKDLFNDQKLKQLEILKKQYFDESGKKEKKRLKKEIDTIIESLAKEGQFDFEVYFSEVFHKNKGFDIVIGNPPYVSAVQHSKQKANLREVYRKSYPLIKGAFDLYALFLLKAINITNKNATYEWIIPNKFLSSKYSENVLEFLKGNGLYNIIDISKFNIFDNASVYPIILNGNKNTNEFNQHYLKNLSDITKRIFYKNQDVKEHKIFSDYKIKIGSGTTGFQAKEIINNISEIKTKDNIRFIVSGSIDRYIIKNQPVRYMGKSYKHPYISYSNIIANSKWHFWNNEKIIIAGMTKEIEATFCSDPLALGVGLYAIYDYAGFNKYFLLAILNSRYLTWYLNTKFKDKHLAGGYLAINKSTIEQLPLIKSSNKEQEKFAVLVNKILEVTKSDEYLQDKSKQAQVKVYEKQIDQLVYELYSLTPEEIAIIEGET